MSLTDHKVDTSADYVGKDISGLDDVPLLSSKQLKERFDSLVKKVVVPKYNKLIDELGEPAHRVGGAESGNLAALDENGDLCDSGVPLGRIEKGRMYGRITGDSNRLKYRIASFHIPAYVATGRNFRIEGYSGVPELDGRGHWIIEVTVTNLGNAYRKTCRLLLADGDITTGQFDMRELDDGEFSLWFTPEPDTDYELFLRDDSDTLSGWAELFTDDTSEAEGEPIAVRFSGSAGIRMGSFRAAVGANSTYTDISVPGARESLPVVVTASDPVPKAVPRSASCPEDGTVRVFWTVTPSEDVTVGLSVVYGI